MTDSTPIPDVAEETSDTQTDSGTSQIQYSVSPGLLARLAGLNISFAFTSYQSNILYLIGRNG